MLMSFERERLAEISGRNIWRVLFLLGAVMLALRLLPPLSFLLALIVLVAAQQGNVTTMFYALLLAPLLNIVNYVIFHQTFEFAIAAKAMTVLMCVILVFQAAAVRLRYGVLQVFNGLLGYVALMLFLSPFSIAPVYSAMKATFFLAFMGGLISMVSVVLDRQIHPGPVRSAVLAVSAFIILGSLFSMPFPSIGYSMVMQRAADSVTNDTYGLFNGVTFHSQSLGTLLAILNAFLLADYLFNLRSAGKFHQVLLCCIPVLVFYTSSRTAMLAYAFSLLVVWFYLSRNRQVPTFKKNKMQSLFVLGILVVVIGLMTSGTMRQGFSNFLRKQTRHEINERQADKSLSEALTETRMGMAQEQIAHFKKSPLIGTGFQVSEDLAARGFTSISDVFRAQIEKGVLPTMVLEEGGMLGAGVMLFFLLTLYHTLGVRQCHCFLSTFSTFLAINMGEATFFSPSGSGGIEWTLCFCALLLDLHRVRYSQMHHAPADAVILPHAPRQP
jgi:hypothetical protein